MHAKMILQHNSLSEMLCWSIKWSPTAFIPVQILQWIENFQEKNMNHTKKFQTNFPVLQVQILIDLSFKENITLKALIKC